MNDWIDGATIVLMSLGGFFFFAGTIGLLRFPDVHCRLHALSKADNIGLGFICMALMLQAESIPVAFKIIVIWLIALVVSALTCFLVANWEAGDE